MVVMPCNFKHIVLFLLISRYAFVFYQGHSLSECLNSHTRFIFGEFDPGSGRTLAACLKNASRTRTSVRVANGRVTRKQPALKWGTTLRKGC